MWKKLSAVGAWVATQLKAFKPSFLSKTPHFNFITAHYFWIVSTCMLNSILIYYSGKSNLAYIDALFFASGASTQAGLNTVNLNQLNTLQQVWIYIFPVFTNPMIIHSSVVRLRLHWFEKRFKDLVHQARARRATISRAKSNPRVDDPGRIERGVAGRNIRVMPNTGARINNDGIPLNKLQASDDDDHTSPGSSGTAVPSPGDIQSSGKEQGNENNQQSAADAPSSPQITFSSTVVRSDGMDPDQTKFPETQQTKTQRQPSAYTQRNRGEEVLRIPNPRDSDRGIRPHELNEDDAPEADDVFDEDDIADERQTSGPGFQPAGSNLANSPSVPKPNPRKRRPTITIAEPPRPSERPHREAAGHSNGGHTGQQAKSTDDGGKEPSDNANANGDQPHGFKFHRPQWFQKGDQQGQRMDQVETTADDGNDESRLQRPRTRTLTIIRDAITGDKPEDAPYLSWTPTLGRNSKFPGLTFEQREELGGIEYRSLKTLFIVLMCYQSIFLVLALVCLLPWILSGNNRDYARDVEDIGQSPTWWAFFTSNSAFFDVGLTLTPTSMVPFQDSRYILIILAFFIIIGNTGFPVMLRGIIWLMSRLVPRNTGLWEELRFLLDHPRRCFTLLFPTSATWWLFGVLIGLNVIDLVFFIILDLNNPAITDLPVSLRIVNGLFQSACTRTAGFSSVSISDLHPAVQVSYMMMMYISVFPIAISIRRTNVYEEKSLGIYEDEDEDNDDGTRSYIGTHLRRQLSFDLWFVFLGLFILCITEGSKITNKEFGVFDILFEIVSAYGTVGLSLGFPGSNTSLSGHFSVVGKLVVIAMQIRGRHRGLPYGLDRAVLLPSAKRFEQESQDVQSNLARQTTRLTQRTTATTTGADMGLRRARTRDRGILTSFLHPGPPVLREERSMSRERHRRMSFDNGHYRREGEDLQRYHTEPPSSSDAHIPHMDVDEDAVERRPRRVFTTTDA